MTTFAEEAARLGEALGGGPAARLAARALLEADVLGLPRFGLAMLEEWSPECRPAPALSPHQPVGWSDVTGSFSPLAVAEAVLHLSQAARAHGVAAVFLRGVRGVGRLAPFVRHLSDQGLVAIAGAEGPPFVAPFGGQGPVIGTNPIALAAGQGAERVVIDLASSAATMADVKAARQTGAALPEGVAQGPDGLPTTVAADVAALFPRGGQVGSLLGLIVEILAGVAGGGRGDAQGRGVFFLAFDPARAGEAVDWPGKLSALRDDWIAAGGHWPRGGGLAEEEALAPEVLSRLESHITRLSD